MGYHVHYVVDGGKARVILDVLVTPADVTENQPMLDLLWRTRLRWGARVRRVTGEAKYGTKEIVASVEKAAIRAYVSMSDFEKKSPYYGASRFVYEPERDLYRGARGENNCARTPTTPTPRGSAGTGRTPRAATPAP